MLLVGGSLTLGLAALAVRPGTAEPAADSTLLADVARTATGGGAAFAAFQAASALLLLAAARHGERARDEVRELFLGPRHLRQYVDLFEQLLRAGGRTP